MRDLVLELSNEICGKGGLGWSRRLQLIHAGLNGAGGFPERVAAYLGKKYGYSAEAGAAAGTRVAELLGRLAARLRKQQEAGSPWYFGQTLTAADVYSAAFMAMFRPLPHDQCPMDPTTRAAFETLDARTTAALDPLLIAHRDLHVRRAPGAAALALTARPPRGRAFDKRHARRDDRSMTSSATPTKARPSPRPAATPSAAAAGAPSLLAQLAGALVSGRIRVVDLTQTLSPDFPQIALPPEMGQCWPFRIEEISAYDARGPGWYWNNFSCGEHTGTHFDAPIHWISGRDLANNSVDTIPAQHFVAPACVIDCSAEASADPDYLLTVADIERFEAAHGRVPEGAWFLMRTDWSKRRDPEAYQNFDETGQHTPGPSAEAVQFLVEQRNVLGFGTEAIGTDAGQGYHLRPPYPCHYTMHGAGRYGLQCLANLDLLPPTGAVLICPPLKIEKGSGSPLRVLALVEDAAAA